MGTLFDVEHRIDTLDDHPIQQRSYTIPTPRIERTYRIVREMVWARRPGIVFYAIPQSGKTTCAEAIEDLIQEEFPQIYVVNILVQRTKKENEKWVPKLILSAMGHAASPRDDPIDLLNNVVAHIRVQLSIRRGNLCVLILDEMQCLNADHYFQLLQLSNALFQHKIRMTTIGFAQPEIHHRYNGFLCRDNRQFIARFLSDLYPFEGCESQSELEKILKFYDQYSEYPEGSRISYTQYFLPQAVEAGLLVEQYAPAIWDTLCKTGTALDGQSIPMVFVTSTVETLLLSSRNKDCASFAFSQQDICDAVKSSGLQGFSGMNQESETRGSSQQS